MAARRSTRIDKWYDGHTPTADAVARVELNRYQRIELAVLVTLIGIVRPFYWLYRRLTGNRFDVAKGLDEVRDIPCRTRGVRFQETDGGDYLTRAEAAEFERTGVLEPFALLTPEEAADQRDFVVRTHEANWHGRHVINDEIVAGLKRHNLWSLKQSALWQEYNVDRIRDIAQRPALTQRLASLLGDEVVAWRTQIFEIPGQSRGTFWHSATTFVEDGDLPTLNPPDDMSPALVNINCWIALEDVDVTNSCMQIVPGTHVDNRLDTMLRYFMNDRIGFIMRYGRRERSQALIAIRYSGDLFLAGQLGFDVAMEIAPDMYESMRPTAFPMKAGECLIFSSNNLHCSYRNNTDDTRLAMGVRTISADVAIYDGQETIPFATGGGDIDLHVGPLKAGTPLHTADGPVSSRLVIDLREQRAATRPGS